MSVQLQSSRDSGLLLTDGAWLGARLEQLTQLYGRAPSHVLGTLWWYSTSLLLVARPVHELILTGQAPGLDPAHLRISVDDRGLVQQVQQLQGPVGDRGHRFGRHLADQLPAMVRALGDVSGAPPARLWAITADSVAAAAVSSWSSRRRGPATASDQQFLVQLAAACPRLRPMPRLDLTAEQWRVRRGSCCQLYRIDRGMCTSCPRLVGARHTGTASATRNLSAADVGGIE